MGKGRPKKQINKVAKERVGIILNELKESQGITQTAFAKAINSTQQNVFKLKSGETDVSLEYAQSISDAYPQYRWQWILGFDDLKSPLDESQERLERIIGEKEQRLLLFKLLADMSGWEIETANDGPVAAPYGETDMTATNNALFQAYVTANKDESSITLDRIKFDKLINRMVGIFNVEVINS